MPKSRPQARGPRKSASSSEAPASKARIWLPLAAVAVIGAVIIVARETCSNDAKVAFTPVDGGDAGFFVPAQHAGEDEGLALKTETKTIEKATRFTLRAGEGEVVLTLSHTPGGEIMFGKATIEASDRDKGEKFLAAFAGWLKVPVPPARKNQTPLEPMFLEYARLGTPVGSLPQTNKLFFPHGDQVPELFFNFWPDTPRAMFLEKDEDYRKGLVEVLAEALRDGPVPRRSAASDPSLAGEAPLFVSAKPLPGSETAKMRALTWTRSGALLGARIAEDKSTIFEWKNPTAAPREIITLDGYVERIAPAPSGTRAAVQIVFPESKRGGISGVEPRALASLDLVSGAATMLIAKGDLSMGFTTVIWSPDASKLALSAEVKTKEKYGAPTISIVIDSVKGTRIAETAPELDVRPLEWSKSGLVVEKTEFNDGGITYRHYLWSGGSEPPQAVPGAVVKEHTSPDGRYRARSLGDRLRVADTKGGERFFTSAVDANAIKLLGETIVTWLGPHTLLLHAEEPIALDLDTLKTRFVTDDRRARVVEASRDGKWLLFTRHDDATLVASRAEK
jgi:hypothetical protein